MLHILDELFGFEEVDETAVEHTLKPPLAAQTLSPLAL
jgi:hypothetical protein